MQTRKKQQTALSRRLTNLPKDRAFFIVEFAPLSKAAGFWLQNVVFPGD